MNIFPKFEEELFTCKFYSKETNIDLYNFNEICLQVGWEQHISTDDWSNNIFKEFIENIKNNKECSFTYMIEKKQKTTLVVKDNIITCDIWDDPGHLFDTKKIKINKEMIIKMEVLHKDIDKFVKEINS